MKRWALVVAGLYMLVVLVLTLPLGIALFGPWGKGGESVSSLAKGWFESYSTWQAWAMLACLALCQLVLLALPVRVASRRPVTRGALWPTVILGGLLAALLFAGATFSIAEGGFGEAAGSDEVFEPLCWAALAAVLVIWVAWSVVFIRSARAAEPRDLVGRHFRLMFRGSVLELLIAVPAHVVARHREYCCAGYLTAIGLMTGIAVMLFAFGPSVFFLYADRWRRLHPEAASTAENGG